MPILKRILVATDLSIAAHRATLRAAQLARQWEANLFLVHARPDWNLFARWHPASSDSYQDVAHATDSQLRKVMSELEASGVHAHCDSRLGKASDVIAAMAAECTPHLVVIGARGEHESANPSLRLGGTALKLLTSLEAPLLLVRSTTDGIYTHSLVAVDAAGPLARRAVLWGSGLVSHGDCHIVHAYGIPYVERLPEVSRAVIETRTRQAEEGAASEVQELLRAGAGDAKVHVHIVQGEPVSAVLTEIARLAPQLVLIGKSASRTRQLPLGVGGVGFRIAYHAPTDVLVIS